VAPARKARVVAMRLRRPLLAQVLLFVSLTGALGFLEYSTLVALRFEEFAEVCTLLLFAWLAVSTKVVSARLPYVFLPVLGVMSFVLVYAYVFTLRTDAPLLPSIFAQRYFVFVLLGPIVYLLCVRGWELADFRRVIIFAMLTAAAGYVAYDVTLAPKSALLSGQFFVLQLGSSYLEAGAELRRLNAINVFLLLYFAGRLLQTRRPLPFASLVVAVSVLLLVITIPRALLASAGVALVLYAMFLRRPGRAALTMLMLPLYISIVALLSPYLRDRFIDAFSGDLSYETRVVEVQKAWQVIREYPLLGFGQDSVQSLSYQDIFGHLYPGDIGLLGATFQYGLAGLFLYLVFVAWLCMNLLRLVWAHAAAGASPRQRLFVWTLFIVCFMFLVASPLQARYIVPQGQGLPIGAVSWGLLIAYSHGLLNVGAARNTSPTPSTTRTPVETTVGRGTVSGDGGSPLPQ
jgi:O-antigen ligase